MRGSVSTLKEYTVQESLISLPIKIRAGGGSPVRAVALIDSFGLVPVAEKGTPG